MVRERIASSSIALVFALAAMGLGWMPDQARAAASTDVTSPAGTVTGAIVVLSRASASGPTLPGIMLLTPTPATGSLIVPLTVPPISGVGPSITRLQLVIPGPNPAQNTSVSLAQLLSTMLAPMQLPGRGAPAQGTSALPVVTVFSTPSR